MSCDVRRRQTILNKLEDFLLERLQVNGSSRHGCGKKGE
jgi:hypothetical protein